MNEIRVNKNIINDVEEIYENLCNNFEDNVESLFVGILEGIDNDNYYQALLIVDYLENIIAEEDNEANLNFITNKVIETNKTLGLFKDKKNNFEFKTVKYKILCLNTMIVEKIKNPKSKNKKRFNQLSYLIFEDRNLDVIKNTIKDESKILTITEKNKNILEVILEYYMRIDEKNIEEIHYMLDVIKLFFNEKYNLINNSRTRYYSIIYDENYYDKEHVKKLCEIINNYFLLDTKKILEKYDINFIFNPSVEIESKSLKSDFDGRKDYTSQEAITIDCHNAMRLDDAIYLEENDNGTYTLYIHIVDVPALIPFNSMVDKEAYRRCEVLYLNNLNIPIYPNKICKSLLSLYPNTVKNAITYSVVIDSDYSVIEDTFKEEKSIVKVKKKLTYDKADEILGKGNDNDLERMLDKLGMIALRLKSLTSSKETYRKVENMFNYDKSCHSLYTGNSISNNIIQESAVLVNYLKALGMQKKGLPYLYRCNVSNLDDNLKMKVDKNPKLLTETEKEIVKNNYLNSFYSLTPLSHDGLGKKVYSHSTSPARRYADGFGQYISYGLIFKSVITDREVYSWEDIAKEVCNYLNKRQNENNNFKNEYNSIYKKLVRKK